MQQDVLLALMKKTFVVVLCYVRLRDEEEGNEREREREKESCCVREDRLVRSTVIVVVVNGRNLSTLKFLSIWSDLIGDLFAVC